MSTVTDFGALSYVIIQDGLSISAVTHCPYCNTNKWDKPVKMENGHICNHPTKINKDGGFGIQGK